MRAAEREIRGLKSSAGAELSIAQWKSGEYFYEEEKESPVLRLFALVTQALAFRHSMFFDGHPLKEWVKQLLLADKKDFTPEQIENLPSVLKEADKIITAFLGSPLAKFN